MRAAPSGDVYEIVVGAPADRAWSAWFDDFTITSDGHETRLRGPLADQAALHGALARFRDLGIPIVAVHRLPVSGRSGADP